MAKANDELQSHLAKVQTVLKTVQSSKERIQVSRSLSPKF